MKNKKQDPATCRCLVVAFDKGADTGECALCGKKWRKVEVLNRCSDGGPSMFEQEKGPLK